jgi:outer membrane lipoprotein
MVRMSSRRISLPTMTKHFASFLGLLLAGCAAQPPFRDVPASVSPAPMRVAGAPEAHRGVDVLWGGSVLEVRNHENHSEIEVLAYPLDRSQRPDRRGGDQGRFVALMPGYLEPTSYPPGLHITLLGRVTGARRGYIGEHAYTWPEVSVREIYRWDGQADRSGPRFHLGIGVGIRR